MDPLVNFDSWAPSSSAPLPRAASPSTLDVFEVKCLAKVNLQVRANNEGAVAFYRRLGYEVEEMVSMGKRLIRDGPPSS